MIINALISFANTLISAIGNLFTLVFGILPDSPFETIYPYLTGGWFKNLNWLIPIPEIIVFLTSWLSAVLVYYIASVFLRFIKAIE